MADETLQFEKPEFKVPSALVNIETQVKYELHPEKTKIGRQPDNQIVISDDIYISSYHVEITITDGQCWLTDLNSRNGTLKNNTAVDPEEPVQLKTGDVVTVGRAKFRVE